MNNTIIQITAGKGPDTGYQEYLPERDEGRPESA